MESGSSDRKCWIACAPGFCLPVRVLSRISTKRRHLPLLLPHFHTAEWVVYAKMTFADPEQLLGYLARYTHRVAIANNRLLDIDETHVSFRWNKYACVQKGPRSLASSSRPLPRSTQTSAADREGDLGRDLTNPAFDEPKKGFGRPS